MCLTLGYGIGLLGSIGKTHMVHLLGKGLSMSDLLGLSENMDLYGTSIGKIVRITGFGEVPNSQIFSDKPKAPGTWFYGENHYRT